MELQKLAGNTYYLDNRTIIGVIKINDREVYLIDAGNDKDTGKKILKTLQEAGLEVKGILATHSHADHIGGCKVIVDRTKAIVYSHGLEKVFIENTSLEPTFLYGSLPLKELENKFLLANSVVVEDIAKANLPLEYFNLPGHSFEMIGFRTNDDVYFLGDALASEETINKYHIFFLYDVASYLKTLDYLSTLKGKWYVASHLKPRQTITDLIELNRQKIKEICTKICNICKTPQSFEKILQFLFQEYQLTMDINQEVLVGSTLKAYLKYLIDSGNLTYEISNSMVLYQTIKAF